MWQFFLLLAAIAAYDLYKLTTQQLRRERTVYIVLTASTIAFGIWYYVFGSFSEGIFTMISGGIS